MISREIEFHAPTELAAALDLLAQRGEEVTLLSGGMSLLPMMNLGLAEPELIVSLNHVEELRYVRVDDGVLRIGAGIRHAQLAGDPLARQHCSALADAAAAIGDVQVRNRGTVGGSVAHADPAADYLPVLALMGAEIVLRSAAGDRRVPASGFFLDFMYTARQPNELVAEIAVPTQDSHVGLAFEKFARVEGSFAIVNTAARVDLATGQAAVGLGGVGPRPLVVAVPLNAGTGLTEEVLQVAGQSAYDASEGASGDVFADAEYRREMARVFTRRSLLAAAGGGAAAGG